jgi:hypothetical protein
MAEMKVSAQFDGDTPENGSEPRRGAVIVGALLVAIGAVMLIERVGLLPLEWRKGIWPVLLMAFGTARLARPTRHGREGLFFVLAGAWWLAGLAGWISLTSTWPLLVVAFGASIVLQGLTTPGDLAARTPGMFPRRHSGAMSWVLLAILAGAFISYDGGREWTRLSDDGAVRVVSVMGRGERHVEGNLAGQADLFTVMGRGSLDLSDATVAPGSEVTVDGLTLMGASVIRVPDNWVVDVRTVAAMGRVRDDRDFPSRRAGSTSGTAPDSTVGDTQASPAPPRLVIKGTVLMGTLIIRSSSEF